MYKNNFMSFEELRKKLSSQMRKNRDKGIREKVYLFYLAAKLQNISEACARRGVSRDFFHRWWKRLQESKFKISALEIQSHRPKKSPKKISGFLEARIRYLRKIHGEGAEMLMYRLQREGHPLSKSTIQYVLNRRNRKPKIKKPKLKTHQKRYELPIPGQRVQMDIKFASTLVTGQKIYVYVAIDECTRWKYAKAYLRYNALQTVEFLEEVKARFPFPIQCFQTDNGTEFTNRLMISLVDGEPKRLHPMEQWCRENKIVQRCIPPGEKELNGKVERSHRIDDEYYYYRAPRETIDAFNIGLGRWMANYNLKRPHGGLKGLTPFEKWQERLLHLPFEEVEERWLKAKERFHKDLPFHQNPDLQLLYDLEKELIMYNDSIRGFQLSGIS